MTKKVQFHQEGRHESVKIPRLNVTTDDKWNRSWMIAADIDSALAFSILVANHWPYQVIWKDKDKKSS